MYKFCSDRFSTHREKPSEESYYDNYCFIMNKSQELTFFHGRQKLTSAKN